MEMSEYRRKYDSLATEDALFEIPHRKEFLLGHIGRGKRVLDVGCLGGKVSRLILEQNNEVWGVELNESAALVAESRGIRMKVADVEQGLPFDSAMFDFVHAGGIIEHLYDTKSFFQEVSRVLKPAGAFLFTAKNLNSLENRLRVVVGDYLSTSGAYPEDHYGDHVRIFNLRKIRELCAQTGFEIDEVRGVPTLETKGKLIDLPLTIASRALPGLSKLLMVKASKF